MSTLSGSEHTGDATNLSDIAACWRHKFQLRHKTFDKPQRENVIILLKSNFVSYTQTINRRNANG